MNLMKFFSIWIYLLSTALFGEADSSESSANHENERKLMFNYSPKFANIETLQETAANPWPHTEDDNLCRINNERKLRVIIIMASDRAYYDKTVRCMKKGTDPVSLNTIYANNHQYGLRMYIDDDIPFIIKHKHNALAGELRKIFAMADASHPQGPKFGYWTTIIEESNPDLVMWVDGDATFKPSSITVEEVMRRTCIRAEFPSNYVRIVGQDSGNNVNAGWYIFGTGIFGSHFLNYLLELAEIYEPCGMWGQNMIQEAMLIAMDGTAPPWTFVLPCTGEKEGCFKESSLHLIKNECNHSKECIIEKSAMYTNKTNYDKLKGATGTTNDCFAVVKYDYVPNAYGNWQRAQISKEIIHNKNAECKESCCSSYNTFQMPLCNSGGIDISNPEELAKFNRTAWWSGSGAGIVFLQAKDPEVMFNAIRVHTDFLWHHGHGRLYSATCE